VQAATVRGVGMLVNFAAYASSVLNNGLGRHDAARDAARRAFERGHLGIGPLIVPELAEAAARTGDETLVRAALQWLSERTRVSPTEWALGMEARVRALLSEGEAAESYYQESIGRLGRTRIRAELARAHLLYGEWLRDGLSNSEIGARLFISSRTVQYHLGKVFTKLGIGSRSQLHRGLPADPDVSRPRPP
jgi:Bacterial regulatory proteins, luxR family